VQFPSHNPCKISYGLRHTAVLAATRDFSGHSRRMVVPTPTQGDMMAKGPLSKSALIQTLVDKYASNLTRKDVKGILESVASIGHAELKKNGIFVVPGLVRMLVVKKPATKARKGINPFTGLETTFKAKPARKVVKGRPVKAAKDAVA
jgi:nucleoid DNA-binding protein